MSEDSVTFNKRKPTGGCGERYDIISRLNGVHDENPDVSLLILVILKIVLFVYLTSTISLSRLHRRATG